MNQKLHITLYGTAHCHLCEEAESLILQLHNTLPLVLQKIDIMDDAALFEQYQTSIPVLMDNQTNTYLYWPFTSQEIYFFLSQRK
jgi:hypothetical protein